MSYTDAYFDKSKDLIHIVERVNGKRIFKTVPATYIFYYPNPKGKYTSIFGERLDKIVCKSKKEFNKEKRMHSRHKLYESDVNPVFRYLEENYPYNKTPNLNIGFFDLEVAFNVELGFAPPDDPFNPITAVALHLSSLNKTICLAVKPDTLTAEQAQDITDQFPDTFLMEDEKTLLLTFIDLVDDVDVLSGWNSTGFDIPYLVNRIVRVLGKEYTRHLCLWKQFPTKREYEKYGKINETYDLIGRQHLDYLELYRKYTYHEMHSYSLDAISEYELSEKKIAYEGTLHQLYNQDFYKFIDYNRQDVELLVKLDKKLQFIDLANVIAHDNCVLLPTTMGSVAQIDQAIINEAHKRNMIVPDRVRSKNTFKSKKRVEVDNDDDFYDYDDRPVFGEYDDDDENSHEDSVAGAYVAQPKVGIHKWIGSIDLNSLYPSILRALNMSPETLIGQIRLDLTNNMLKEFETVVKAWEGKFATPEYELVMSKDKNTLLYVDFENGDTKQLTGAEIYNMIFNNRSDVMLTSNGTLFTTEKIGVIPGLLKRWYTERKELQAKAKSFKGVNDEEFAFWDKRQLVKKILLNSLYGALLNVGSRFFDARLGQSTTLTGRCIDQHMAATVNEVIAGVYDYKGDAVIYCVDGSTELHINDNVETIKNLYDRIHTTSNNGIKYLYDRDISTLSLNPNTENREYKKVTAISKQTVKKKMYKVWIDDTRNITVSEDHRFIVKRNGELIEATVNELRSDDIFITVTGYVQQGVHRIADETTKENNYAD